MRLTIIILVFSLMQVSAATFGQNITLKENHISLENVFRQIRKQTGYDILLPSADVPLSTVISVNFMDEPLLQVMEKLLTGLPLSYTLDQKTVVIKVKEKSFIEKVLGQWMAIDIQGRVVDEQGNPIPGATIRVKGTGITTIAGTDGRFALKNVAGDAVLEIMFLGFKTREVKAAAVLGEIKMEVEVGKLDEVTVNAGYYTVKERERTGSISKVTAETIEKQPVNNPLMALQGRVTGLQITQQDGTPGGGIDVQIRGRSSINNSVGNDPLYVINNVIYPSTRVAATTTGTRFSPFSLINPNDIESIEVLKDADATAIYGSRGANGVILITTKRGKNWGTNRINASLNYGYSHAQSRLKLLNTDEYLMIRKEALKNDGLSISSTDYDLNGSWDNTRYTDWQKELIGKSAKNLNAYANINGGNEKIDYLIGANYYEEGSVSPGDFLYNRGGFNTNLNIGSDKDKFNINFTASYTLVNSKLPNQQFVNYIFLAPNAPNPYDSEGQLNWQNGTFYSNPMAELLKTTSSKTNNLISNLNLRYSIHKDFQFKISLGYTGIKRTGLNMTPIVSLVPSTNPTSTNRVSNYDDSSNISVITEPQIIYNTKLGKGNLNTLLGFSYQENSSEQRRINASGFNSDGVMENIAAASNLTSTFAKFQYKYAAIFSRINYSLNNRYFLNLTARRDGSSRFGEDKKFSNFGAVGAAWVFSDEKGVKKVFPVLSFGKIRASYGITGNDQIPDYEYLQLYSFGPTYQGIPTIQPSKLGNKDFSWEINRKLEVALQTKFFDNKISFEFSWYRNRSSNQLLSDPLPPSTGNTSLITNRPALVQNTGLEFTSDIKVLNKKNVNWITSFNLSVPKNKLVSYPGIETSSYASTLLVGKPLSIRQVYNVRGINKQTGLYDIEDFDGNGVLNNTDRYLYKFTGLYFFGGLQNTIQIKQFSLDFLFSFTKQNSSANYLTGSPSGYWTATNNNRNMPTVVLNRWVDPNSNSSVPKASTTLASLQNASNATINGGENIQDASYIRLKSLALSYSLPKRFIEKLKINNALINLQGQNLLTWTNFIGLDPETQSNTSLPLLRTLVFGINLSF